MSGTLVSQGFKFLHLNPFLLCNLFFFLFVGSALVSGETFTNSECNNARSTMGSCASQWDSIRIACKSAVTTNTVWPGPCECGYFANDLPCFDDQALCAAQVWSQVPQWFRDGVTSCIMKDRSFTIRAQLGTFSNPFYSSIYTGIAGALQTFTPTSAQTGGSISNPTASPTTPALSDTDPLAKTDALSTGTKAGIGIGVSNFFLLLGALVTFLIRRRRGLVKAAEMDEGKEKSTEMDSVFEEDRRIYEVASKEWERGFELGGRQKFELESPIRYELGSPQMFELESKEGKVHVGELPGRWP